jgi:Holliday junction DNA helicase RuvA
MIGRLEGVLRERTPTRVLVDVGGVGYQVLIPLSTFGVLPDEGKVVALHVHTHVREDAIVLFGFGSARERAAFELLLHASRVGPKLALTVLSGIGPEDLGTAIRSGDAAVLQSVSGVGRRMAERIVVELRDRVDEWLAPTGESASLRRASSTRPMDPQERVLEQILSALSNLGVARAQAERVSRETLAELGMEQSIESLVRATLRRLSR